MKIQKTSLPCLEKAYTFFIVPFYYENDDWNVIHKERLNKWVPISSELYNEDVLYPYIMDMFKVHSHSQKTSLDIFEFNSEDNGVNSQLFVERILDKKNIALIGKNSAEKQVPKAIEFRLMNEKNFAPHLFISSSAKIGIFTFSIELLGEKSMDNLNTLNYYLHKRNELDNYQCLCYRPEKQDEITVTPDYKTINSSIPNIWKLNQKITKDNIDYLCWNLNDFVDCLLGTMGRPREGQKRIKYFSKERMHMFTFCSILDTDDILTFEDIAPSLLRLSRCVNNNYMLPYDQLLQQESVLQTYENIFFSSGIEGTAMMCVGKKNNIEFIKGIHEKFNRQYLLIYILVLIQRYTLQSLERVITEYKFTDEHSKSNLFDLIDIICHIKVNCYYTDVSIYSHHSQFYQHCCKNLHIPETFAEINEKVELLKLTTNRRINDLMEAQRKTQLEEARKRQSEIERIKKKEIEDAKYLKKEQAEAERRHQMLNGTIALLTIVQVIQAAYEVLKPDAEKDTTTICISIGLGVLCAIILIILMRKDIADFFKNN